MVSGADGEFQVKVTMDGKEVELTTPVFWDWDDDDEDQLRISFFVKTPEGMR